MGNKLEDSRKADEDRPVDRLRTQIGFFWGYLEKKLILSTERQVIDFCMK